jgi:TonB family protein
MKKISTALGLIVVLGASVFGADQPDRRLVHQEQPEYPAIAAKMNLHGTVKLKIWIKDDGSVRRLEYIGGHPLLAESALKAVKNWKYQTAANESTTQVELKF